MNKNLCFILFLLLLSEFYMSAQTEVNVLTKKIEKSYIPQKGAVLKISSVKAAISIKSWTKNEVKITALLTAKNKDIKIAKEDIEYISFYSAMKGKTIETKNVFAIPQKKKQFTSILEVKYEIYIPNNIEVEIENKYGSIVISNLDVFLRINSEFCDLQLTNISGQAKISTKLCKINATGIFGTFVFDSDNSEFNIKEPEGNINITNNTGKIDIEFGDNLKSLTINSSYSEIICKTDKLINNNYALSARYGKIIYPDDIFKKESIKKMNETEFEYNAGNGKPVVTISTSFNNIKLGIR